MEMMAETMALPTEVELPLMTDEGTFIINGSVIPVPGSIALLLVAAGDNVVRLLPPLIIGDEEIAEAMTRLDRALTTLTRSNAAQ